jgi:hypothetical protein
MLPSCQPPEKGAARQKCAELSTLCQPPEQGVANTGDPSLSQTDEVVPVVEDNQASEIGRKALEQQLRYQCGWLYGY